MKKYYIIFVSLLVAGIAAGIFYFTIYRQAGMELPEDVIMETSYGEEFAFADMPEKVRLLEFIYINCPDICPATTVKMKQVKEELEEKGVFGDEIEFLTVTIDPKRDTNEALQQYAKTFEIEKDTGWYFLRGSEEDTLKVAEPFKFKYRDPGNGMIIHTSSTYLLDENNHIIEIFGMGEKGFDKDEVMKKILKEI